MLEKDALLQKLNAEIEAARKELASAGKFKSEFIANISHELRTPITTIVGYGEILQEDLQNAGLTEHNVNINKIVDSARHLLDIINDMLDLSLIEVGNVELFLETVPVKKLIQDAQTAISPILQENSNALQIIIAPNVNTLFTDPVRVRQSLVTLLSNAAKLSKNSVVTLEAKLSPEDNNFLQLSVKIQSAEITLPQLKKLFQAFSEADNADTARKYGNLGLGLYLTRRFCEMLGGGITLESQDDNSATFSMILPLKTVPGSKQTIFAPKFSEVSNIGKNTILIIDESANVHRKIQEILGQVGLNVLHAFNAEEGLKLARLHKPATIVLDIPDVITIDIMMPAKMDSWAVLSAIKSEPSLANTPVIILSGISKENLGFALKGVVYVSKPVDIDALADKITNMLPKT